MKKSLKLSDGYLLHVLLFVIATILIYHFVFGNKKDGFFVLKNAACNNKENGQKCSYPISTNGVSSKNFTGRCKNNSCE